MTTPIVIIGMLAGVCFAGAGYYSATTGDPATFILPAPTATVREMSIVTAPATIAPAPMCAHRPVRLVRVAKPAETVTATRTVVAHPTTQMTVVAHHGNDDEPTASDD